MPRPPGDEAKALRHYQCNIQISEALYPVLSTLEVALRNAVNRELIHKFGVSDWYSHFSTTPGLAKLNKDITGAQQQITRRNELVTPPKVVAELTLGFWVRLFNAEFERTLWKDLRRVFPNLPKVQKQRKNVSAPLNNFRNLRNRVFHNEPICWRFTHLQQAHQEMRTVLGWINKDLPSWLQPIDRFDSVLQDVINKLK
ncbi:hypothetical protein AHMF7605_23645 [Adhaeribacter arboris]|uniref:CAAX protease n=1 Tax=Adhaeribacter arboris TaxID=2072846 RepID=A0A2T2YLB1_9BACT|nr:Abi family protein [Adhaeribacter arboris]PSR56279.1 hypothetical protein AHMF7605_23645 [Adhaeribacter arboris]